MLNITTVGKEIRADFTDSFSRVWIYLDNWALVNIAKDQLLKERFLAALRKNGSLLFSFTNAIEIGGPAGNSAAKLKVFLSEIENYWIPTEMNAETVITREEKGMGRTSPISERLLTAVLRRAIASQEKAPVFRADGATLFNLAHALEGAQQYANDALGAAEAQKAALAAELRRVLAAVKTIPLGPGAWIPNTPLAGAQIAMLRALASESGRTFVDNDAFDLFHAMMAAAYADIAALDKRWNLVVKGLSTMIKVPPTFYAPELEQMLATFEQMVSVPTTARL